MLGTAGGCPSDPSERQLPRQVPVTPGGPLLFKARHRQNAHVWQLPCPYGVSVWSVGGLSGSSRFCPHAKAVTVNTPTSKVVLLCCVFRSGLPL